MEFYFDIQKNTKVVMTQNLQKNCFDAQTEPTQQNWHHFFQK